MPFLICEVAKHRLYEVALPLILSRSAAAEPALRVREGRGYKLMRPLSTGGTSARRAVDGKRAAGFRERQNSS
jgi:hypothetical protein